MVYSIKIMLTAFISGIIFALGLVLSGMTDPMYVQGFLNFGGILFPETLQEWYPRLAFVMVGAIAVMWIVFHFSPQSLKQQKKPLFADKLSLPTKKELDRPLILGSILFGLGWGLAGYCPGPALSVWFVSGSKLWIFVPCLVVGILLAKTLQQRRT